MCTNANREVKEAFLHPSMVSKIYIQEEYHTLDTTLQCDSEGIAKFDKSLSKNVMKGHLHLALVGGVTLTWMDIIMGLLKFLCNLKEEGVTVMGIRYRH